MSAMSVIECSCGMVMSVSAVKPRNRCIRCGGVEFGELERRKPAAGAWTRPAKRTVVDGGNDLSFSPIAFVATIETASMGYLPSAEPTGFTASGNYALSAGRLPQGIGRD